MMRQFDNPMNLTRARISTSLSLARTIVPLLAMVISITSAAAQGPLPRSVTMQELAVPGERLPAGCGLAPADSERLEGNRVRGGLWAGLPISANPWAGNDGPTIATIRQRLEPPVRVPDGPPPTRGELSRFRLRMADGVDEGYAAVYRQSGPEMPPILVYALRFAGAGELTEHLNSTRTVENPRIVRVVIGPLVAAVHGDGSECFEAVSAYLKSLARQ